MIKVLFKLPRELTVAFSGGVDSLAVVDFLKRNHKVHCAFYHHGTENSELAQKVVREYCKSNKLTLTEGYLKSSKPKTESWEEFWRNQRYGFLAQFPYVVTAHHLDDCVETYLWSSLHGNPKIVLPKHKNVYRPFLTTTKDQLVYWCRKHTLEWAEDTSNQSELYTRNYVRKHLVPVALKVNPGLHKVVKKMVLSNLDAQNV